jgi:DeoR/GlpR family transcriptional regulator of sugar metabolism
MTERQSKMLSLLSTNGQITTRELSRRFGVSKMTARRDLEQLQDRGMIRRTFGGAVLPSASLHGDTPTERREETPERLAVAAAAAHLARGGEAIFFDCSLVAYLTARRVLQDEHPLTVITNSVPLMTLVAASGQAGVRLVALAGRMRAGTASLVGVDALRDARAHYVDRAFVSATLSPSGRLTDADAEEAAVKRAMLEQAETPVLLLDSALNRGGAHEIGAATSLALAIGDIAERESIDTLNRFGVQLRQTTR